jgi:hypothetical protein
VFEVWLVKDCSQFGPEPLSRPVFVPTSAPTTIELIASVMTRGSSWKRWQIQPANPPPARQIASTSSAAAPKFQCSVPTRWVTSRFPATMYAAMEKSRPPTRMTSVCPAAAMPRKDAWSRIGANRSFHEKSPSCWPT